jgi:gluconolactonase
MGAMAPDAAPASPNAPPSQLAANGGGRGSTPGVAGGAGSPAVVGHTPDVDADAGTPPSDAGQAPADPIAPTQDDFPAADSFPKLEAAMFGTPKLISSQFDLAEGPVWDHCQSLLLFVDVNNRRIHTFVPGGAIGVYMERTNYVNGMIFDPEGRLLLAEMGGNAGGRITRMKRDMTIEVLIDHTPSGFLLATSDDLTMAADGTIYFSDPDITHGPHIGSLGTAPFYQLKPGEPGMRQIVSAGRGYGTNGIRLTRDGKTLLVVEYSGGNVAKYDVQADGSVKAAGNLVTGLTRPDSMCLDVAGNVYVGMDTGIQVLRPDGSKVTVLRVGSNTTNCAFGGPDGKTMFITAWTKFLQLDGLPVPGLEWHRNKHMKCD